MSGVKSDSLRVSGHLAELELANGKVARLDTKTGKLDLVEAEVGVMMEAGCDSVLCQPR